MREQRVFAIGYGSILSDPSEIGGVGRGIPVRVDGYARHIQLPASYRAILSELGEDADHHRGVFDIERSDGREINGVLYPVSQSEMERLDQRESQYDVNEVGLDDVTPYIPGDLNDLIPDDVDPEEGRIIIYNSDNPRETDQQPHPRYLAEVLAGAKSWEQTISGASPDATRNFTRDLLQSSAVRPGETLYEYLEQDWNNWEKVLYYLKKPSAIDEQDWVHWSLHDFLAYDGGLEAESDDMLDLRKWRNAVLEWGPATDEQLWFEVRYMNEENAEIARSAMLRGAFRDPVMS